ncbi:MAG TPA: peptide-N-glycosidase F-related protein [Oligoflexus sp.]|uniref:peptide-N-glycosidase F-related protein n=1 Tax=Oligoflexus sp. TaxID=1971216 RepID=UPI002D2BCD78|nr:peptide-N-glycosidase F-related protein [Oligoflexus sp.]HYX36258.1 peptide-N-glycosidase F-related protein [Oligoflexus sp.]
MHPLRILLGLMCSVSFSVSAAAPQTLRIFNDILFYDGYAAKVSEPIADGVLRHRNDLYARPLTEQELLGIGSTLTAHVTIKAACDNYDRIGNINLALVPKGSVAYSPEQVARIELGRFITPFMNKNLKPDAVPYSFQLDHVAAVLNDAALHKAYDFWVELEVFGVPYAAQNEVAGCAGRNDVFYGSLDFVSQNEPVAADQAVLLPLNFKKNLNNYEAGATDNLGQTVRTIAFDLPYAVRDARFYLITSNHGANAGGEEYNRRVHDIFFDDQLVLSYKPGGVSCEPFRVYNTQGNGIYGRTPRTPEQWASFSNWCPGQAIPLRVIAVGDLAAGQHSFKISVPTAVFVEAQGYIPVSLYLQGHATP